MSADDSKLPEEVQRSAESECAEQLDALARRWKLPHPSLLFIGDDGLIYTRQQLNRFGPRIAMLEFRKGLVGAALRDDRIWVWPEDPGSEANYEPVDDNTVLEITAPILYRGTPAAVLLIDYFRGEAVPQITENFKREIAVFCASIAELLERHGEQLEDGVPQEITSRLRELSEECRQKSGSVRGYVAIKKWDGVIRYFTRREDEKVFRRLDQAEGLCGYVFSTGHEVVAEDVNTYSGYFPSDFGIRSEVVLPIFDNSGVTIGVLNMESSELTHFAPNNSKVNAARDVLNEIRPYVLRFRDAVRPKLKGYGYHVVATELIARLIAHPHKTSPTTLHRAVTEITDIIVANLVSPLDAKKGWVWHEGSDAPPLMSSLRWHDSLADGIISVETGGRIAYTTFRSYGKPMAVIGLHVGSDFGEATRDVLQQVCRIAERLVESRVEWSKFTLFESIIAMIRRGRPDSTILYSLVRDLRDFMEADQCSIFGPMILPTHEGLTKTILVPVASTSNILFETSRGNLYYDLDEGDGLTGWIAKTKNEIVIPGTSDFDGEVMKRGIPNWKRKMSEERDRPLSSFIGLPILDINRARLLGVIRMDRSREERRNGDRAREGSRGAFREDRIEPLKSIVLFLGAAYAENGLLVS